MTPSSIEALLVTELLGDVRGTEKDEVRVRVWREAVQRVRRSEMALKTVADSSPHLHGHSSSVIGTFLK
jgi:hypothetical protein